jgi:hypothetical protein
MTSNESIGGVSGLSRTNCDDKISQGDIICDINSASGGVDSANGASLKTSCDTLANGIRHVKIQPQSSCPHVLNRQNLE